MTHANLLVPGTGGITLVDSLGRDTGYPVKMELGVRSHGLFGLSADALVELLSMEHLPGQEAPQKTSLAPGLALLPGHLLQVAYNQVPSDFESFLYDWRADLRWNAARLRDLLVTQRPAHGRWNLVGHSQGALLIVLASKLFDRPGDFAKVVASVVLVAGPLAGTINAARALIQGDMMGEAAEPAFQAIVRTWPALYQMLPSWPCLVGEHGQPSQQALTDAAAWAGLAGVSDDLLQRARQTQALLRDPASHLDGDVDLTVIMTKTRATAHRLRTSNGVLTGTVHEQVAGDTLVPYGETLRWLTPALAPYVKSVTGPVREHAFLFDDPTVMALVRGALR